MVKMKHEGRAVVEKLKHNIQKPDSCPDIDVK